MTKRTYNWRLPGQTCPDIDVMIKTIQHLEGNEVDRSDVRNMTDQLEDLRTSNSGLRAIAEEAIEEVEQLEQRVGELEDEISQADDKINQLESDNVKLDAQLRYVDADRIRLQNQLSQMMVMTGF